MGSLVGFFSAQPNMSSSADSSEFEGDENCTPARRSASPAESDRVVLDFNQYMRDNVENIRVIQQQSLAQQIETNRAVRSHGRELNKLRHQFQEGTVALKDEIVAVGEANQKQVSDLRTEVNHLREQVNVRMEQLEADLEAQRGREHQRAVQALEQSMEQGELNAEVASTLAEIANVLIVPPPTISDAAGVGGEEIFIEVPIPETVMNTPADYETEEIPQSHDVTLGTDRSRGRGGSRQSSRGARRSSSVRKTCQFCGKSLAKTYLPRHIKSHCLAAREHFINVV